MIQRIDVFLLVFENGDAGKTFLAPWWITGLGEFGESFSLTVEGWNVYGVWGRAQRREKRGDEAEEIELGEEKDDFFSGILREPFRGWEEIGCSVLDAAV